VGQVLHGSATTTHAVRAAIQRSQASIQALSERYGINPKTVAKWRKRTRLDDQPMGPRVPRSTVLSAEEETLIVAFRRHTLLPLDDCLYALQATVPHLTRSSLHRLFQRHQISRLPTAEGTRPRQRFRNYPLGYVHIDLAEVWTQAGKLCSWLSIVSASLPSPSYTNGRRDASPRIFFAG
jgi:transposase-like protein